MHHEALAAGPPRIERRSPHARPASCLLQPRDPEPAGRSGLPALRGGPADRAGEALGVLTGCAVLPVVAVAALVVLGLGVLSLCSANGH